MECTHFVKNRFTVTEFTFVHRSRIMRGALLGNMLKQLVIKKCMSCY